MTPGVADLSTDSAVQIALESATFPSGARRVPWFPVVGIAGEGIDDAPLTGTIWEAVFDLLPLVPGDPGEFDSPMNPETSDLVVPIPSQKRTARRRRSVPFNRSHGVPGHGPVRRDQRDRVAGDILAPSGTPLTAAQRDTAEPLRVRSQVHHFAAQRRSRQR